MMKRSLLSLLVLTSLTGAASPPTEEDRSSLRVIAASTERMAQAMTAPKPDADPLTASCAAGFDLRNSDLCAQWKAADAAERSALWAWIGSLGVAVALGLTVWSNHIARDTARRQLRAYIHAEAPKLHSIESTLGKVWLPEIKWQNAGSTPASEVKAWMGWKIRTSDLPSDWTFDCENHNEGSVSVGPGQHWTSSSHEKIPVAIMARIAEGDNRLFMWGRVSYKDAFGKSHESKMAIEMTSERTGNGLFVTNWVALNRHNSIT